MAGLRLRRQWYDFPVEFKIHDWSLKAAGMLGLRGRRRVAPRAAGVELEGTLHTRKREEEMAGV